MHFLLVCGTAPTLSNAIRPYPKPLKNCKAWKNAFFSALRDGPTAIQRYPSLSQTLEKLQNLEKSIFCCFAGGFKTWLQNLEKCIFCWFPGRLQHYPTLSVLILDPRKIAKPGKILFFTGSQEGQNLEKLQNLEKCIFCFFAGGPQRYPTLSVLIPDPRKIAKPGKMHFLLVCRRAKTWKNCKTWKNAFFAALREGPNAIQRYPSLSETLKKCKTWKNDFFAGFREGFNAIQRYPSLSQTLEKLQNLEKCIFYWFAGRPKLGKIAKPGKMRRASTLSNAIRPYPKPPGKIAKPGKMHFLLVSGKAPTLSNAIRPYPRP